MTRHTFDSVLPASVTRAAVLAVAVRAADLVAEMQRAGLREIRSKGIATDLVTEADVASERLIRAGLHDLDPGIAFWGEESNRRPDADAFWLVDPIDGTVNFAAGQTSAQVAIPLVNDTTAEGNETFGIALAAPAGGATLGTTTSATVTILDDDD